MLRKHWSEWLWDSWCIVSGIGIWPRYIEPRLLEVTYLNLPIPDLPTNLCGLKLLHFSDLHWSNSFLPSLKRKLIRKINALEPDLIFFTGDFLCRSQLENGEELKKTLQALKAKVGYFAVLGNHDYAQFVTVNQNGDYDVEKPSSASNIGKGFKRLLHPVTLTGQVTPQAQKVHLHSELVALLEQTPFQLLDNVTQLVTYRGEGLNICGLGEYSLGKFHPHVAFQQYNPRYPGVILSHNPDTIEKLRHFPGEIVLAGHTHGGQVNLPILWKRFTIIENLRFKQGLKRVDQKWAYINRGISSVMKFRWFAAPELTLLTLQKG